MNGKTIFAWWEFHNCVLFLRRVRRLRIFTNAKQHLAIHPRPEECFATSRVESEFQSTHLTKKTRKTVKSCKRNSATAKWQTHVPFFNWRAVVQSR